MAYVAPKNWALESLRAYLVRVIAALVALKALERMSIPGMEALAGDWIPKLTERVRAFLGEVDRERAERDAARDHEIETSAVVRLLDAAWDSTLTQLSGYSFMLANKSEKAPPYVDVFGKVKARDLVSLGPAKATEAGRRIVERTRATGRQELVALANALDVQTTALREAEETDQVAETEALVFDVKRATRLRATERLIAEIEVELLTRFPGRRDLVRAVLDTRPEKRSKPRSEEPVEVEAEA